MNQLVGFLPLKYFFHLLNTVHGTYSNDFLYPTKKFRSLFVILCYHHECSDKTNFERKKSPTLEQF